jgi:flavin reductase (DIM6/NTAB) family NADH-FMN oxidoreductase RutF
MSAMFLDFKTLDARERYKLLTATIVPRPIALVTTRNEDGGTNAAPFSFFNVFSEDPPLVVLGLESRKNHELKDTTANIRRTGEFIVHLVDELIAEAMVVCAANFPANVSEIPAAGFTLEKSTLIDVERIVEAPFAFSCRRVTVLQFAKTRDLAIGEILGLDAREGLIDTETMRVNWDAYRPVGRLFATHYTRTNDRFSLRIPTLDEIGDNANKEE